MLQNMYFGREIFAWSHLYFCVIDFRKVESTLFHDSSELSAIRRKMGLPEWPQDKTIAEADLLIYNREETQI